MSKDASREEHKRANIYMSFVHLVHDLHTSIFNPMS